MHNVMTQAVTDGSKIKTPILASQEHLALCANNDETYYYWLT
jgi:hypothetical protein